MPEFTIQYKKFQASDNCKIEIPTSQYISKTIGDKQYYFIANTFLNHHFFQLWNNFSIESLQLELDVFDLFSEVNGLSCLLIISSDVITLFSDPMGFHPLYYTLTNEGFSISSEQRELVKRHELNPSLHTNAMDSYLSNGHLLSGQSWFSEVHRVPAACRVDFSLITSTCTKSQYWSWSKLKKFTNSSEWRDNYISSFVKPFQSLDPTLNYCVGLSGGLDSRWIANELIHLPKKCAYTFSEKKSYDLSLAKNVCDALNIRHHLLDIQNEKISDRIQAFCNVDGMLHIGHLHEGKSLDFGIPDADVLLNGFYGGGVYSSGHSLNKRINLTIAKQFFKGSPTELNVDAEYYNIDKIDPFVSDHRIRSQSAYSMHLLSKRCKVILPFYNMKWMAVNYSIDDALQMDQQFYLDALQSHLPKSLTRIAWQKTGFPLNQVKLNGFLLKLKYNPIRELLYNSFGRSIHFVNYTRYTQELNGLLHDYGASQFCKEQGISMNRREMKFRVLSLLIWKNFMRSYAN
jgi:hypothetical protein